ncbi:transferase [Gigaspora rosea]|uniref:Transferase n=1 Tax=Gigaspora rosea TaxID=44941 RepID=A0A397U0B7_9GLOM|nr:transferase [Gigaspora rosea]
MSVTIKETIYVKPTKPTKHVQIPLSNCDLLMPSYYFGEISFFKNVLKKKIFMNSQKLIVSLEDVLNDYYPLAGTLKNAPDGRTIIDCNDCGVQFIIAECSDITINQLENKKWEHAVIPQALTSYSRIPNKIDPILFIVQHTTFADGSVALSTSIHHQIADAFGFYTFMKSWGRRARLEHIDPPIHDRSLLKTSGNPPAHVPHEYLIMQPGSEKVLNVQQSPAISSLTKIFQFSQDNLKRLSDYYSVGINNGNWISTNDALVAHNWRTVTRARKIDLNTEVFCGFAIDGRDRLIQPIPKSYFGNVTFSGCPKMVVSQLINGLPSSVALQIRKTVTDMNNSRIQSTIDWIEQQPDKSLIIQRFLSNGKDLVVTNWSKCQEQNLINFGDGTSIKQRLPGRGSKVDGASVIFSAEDGTDIYIILPTEKLEILEHDPEFKKFIVS